LKAGAARVSISRVRALYRHSCPNCGGVNTEARLIKGLPCPKCLPPSKAGELAKRYPGVVPIEAVYEALRESGTLKDYEALYRLYTESRQLERFFEKALGSKPWGAPVRRPSARWQLYTMLA